MGHRIFKASWAVLLFLFCGVIAGDAYSREACVGPKGGKEGQCAPDFELLSTSGEKVSLSDFRGKVVFLNFWATWCEPCKVEIPSMETLNAKLRDKNFHMISVSIDSEGKKEISKFFDGRWPSFPVLMDADHKVSHLYGTFKVPETYIIGPEGKVRDRVEGIRDWSESMTVHYLELLSEKK